MKAELKVVSMVSLSAVLRVDKWVVGLVALKDAT